MPEGTILVARESAMFDYAGRRVYIREGITTAREGHPVLAGREHLFKPLVPVFEAEPAPERPAAPRPEPPGKAHGKQPAAA